MAYQPSIDQGAKDPLTSQAYREFLSLGANNPPFRTDNGSHRLSEDASVLADGKVSRFLTLDEKIKETKKQPKVLPDLLCLLTNF